MGKAWAWARRYLPTHELAAKTMFATSTWGTPQYGLVNVSVVQNLLACLFSRGFGLSTESGDGIAATKVAAIDAKESMEWKCMLG